MPVTTGSAMPGNHYDALKINGKTIHRSFSNSWAGFSSAIHDVDDTFIKQGSIYHYIGAAAVYKCPADRGRGILRKPITRSYAISWACNANTNEYIRPYQNVAQVEFPSDTFVFVDEHEDSVDDGHFMLLPFPYEQWINTPSGRHGNSASLSFIDGHAEIRRWKAPMTMPTRQNRVFPGPALEDLKGLQKNLFGKLY